MQPQSSGYRKARIAWATLTLVLIVEALGAAALVWQVLQGFFAAAEEPLAQRLSLLVAVLLSWVWICVTLAGALGKRGWARGSALTIHVLMFAGGTGVLQGILDDPLLGWGLVLLAFAGFFSAIFAKPVVADETAEA